MEELIISMLENAPAVAVLVWLVYRLDKRLQRFEEELLALVTSFRLER